MTNRQKLTAFVKAQHGEQKRKYTGEPYFVHLEAVANAAEKTDVKYGWEIGLCHDLLEDTECTDVILFCRLHDSCKFDLVACRFIVQAVKELTDHFTTEKYPYLNRQVRKQCEALRLHTISREAQIVKCCDFIDNSNSIMEHDLGFAKKYIPEKREILKGLTKIDGKIKSDVWNCLLDAEDKLKGVQV